LGDGEEVSPLVVAGVADEVAGLFGAAVLRGDEYALGAGDQGRVVVVGLELVASLVDHRPIALSHASRCGATR
jgi:hypothetical protein